MMSGKDKLTAKVMLSLTIVFIAACEIFYFRNVLFSDRLFGDTGDGLLTNLIAEHWFRFFSGREAFRDLIIFFPVENTLSYSDTLFIFGVIHSLFRLFGINIFASYKLTLILVHVFGVFSMLYLLRRKMKLSFPACIVGVILFAYSNMLIANAHTQLYAYFLLPFLLILIYSFFESLHESRNKRLIYGCAAIVAFMSILFNSFYIGYFFFLLATAFLIVFLSICSYKRVNPGTHIFAYIKTNKIEIVVFLCMGIASVCPFLYVYLPALQSFGARNWSEVALLLPSPVDYINLAENNLLYGKLLKDLPYPHSLGELQIGFPYLTIIAFFTSLVYAYRHMPPKIKRLTPVSKKRKCRKETELIADFSILQYMYMMLISLGVAVLWMLLTITKFGEDFSLWSMSYEFLPGVAALRAVSRTCQTLMLPVSIMIAFYADVIFIRIPRKRLKVAAMSLAIMAAMMEYTWTGGIHATWRISDVRNKLDNIPPPPVQCEIMYLTNFKHASPSAYFFMDMWMIADHFNLKTIGGYSGQSPRGWNLWCAPEDYEENARNWISAHELKNVYSYNLDTMQWQAFKI